MLFLQLFTLLGLGINVALGIVDLDLPMDIRDLVADCTVNFEPDRPGWWGTIALDLVGVIPIIGALKYTDDVGYGLKTLLKQSDKADDLAGDVKRLNELISRGLDEAEDVAKKSDDVADAAKKVEEVVESGIKIKGYSAFADGMSPEDAARYIKNNEMKFFEEFSERAKDSGLSDAQISEAFDAMRTGDYKKNGIVL